jgi:hypothetical protein
VYGRKRSSASDRIFAESFNEKFDRVNKDVAPPASPFSRAGIAAIGSMQCPRLVLIRPVDDEDENTQVSGSDVHRESPTPSDEDSMPARKLPVQRAGARPTPAHANKGSLASVFDYSDIEEGEELPPSHNKVQQRSTKISSVNNACSPVKTPRITASTPKISSSLSSPVGNKGKTPISGSALRKTKSEGSPLAAGKRARLSYGSSPKPSAQDGDEPQAPQSAREAFEVREAGKSLQIADDLQFLIDGLGGGQTMAVRALSALKLAQECASSDARMYLRAHNLLPTIFSKLKDAPSHPALGLNTACLLFALSRDSLSPDVESLCVPLLADLVQQSSACNTPSNTTTKAHERMLVQVKALVDGFRQHHPTVAATPRSLALETCFLVLAQNKRTSFCAELRVTGMLDALVDSLTMHASALESTSAALLADVEAILRVLQRAIFRDTTCQVYLVHLRGFASLSVLTSLVSKLSKHLAFFQQGAFKGDSTAAVCECLFGSVRVLLGLTHNNEDACGFLGGMVDFIKCLLSLCRADRFPPDHSHDGLVLAVSLLVNLVEHTVANRAAIVSASTEPIWEPLLQLYASGVEDSAEHAAEDETSKSIIAAYTAVLISFLCKDHPAHQDAVRAAAPGRFTDMAHHVAQFEAYRHAAGLGGDSDMESVIKLLVSFDNPAVLV